MKKQKLSKSDYIIAVITIRLMMQQKKKRLITKMKPGCDCDHLKTAGVDDLVADGALHQREAELLLI